MSKILNAPAGAPGDPAFLNVLTEIDIIAHLSSNAFRKLLPSELTEAQYGVLNRLTRIGEPESISQMANAFQVAQPTMTSTVKKLVEKGFVRLRADKSDARIKIVAITAKGRRMRDKTVDSLRPLRKRFLQDAPDVDWDAILPSLTALRIYLDQNR